MQSVINISCRSENILMGLVPGRYKCCHQHTSVSPAPRAGCFRLAEGAAFSTPPASGKRDSPANRSGGTAAVAAGAGCPSAQGQRTGGEMLCCPSWLSLAGVSPVCCSGGRDVGRAAPASCCTSLSFSPCLFNSFRASSRCLPGSQG